MLEHGRLYTLSADFIVHSPQHTNFEKAAISAAKNVFSGATVQGKPGKPYIYEY